MDWLDVLVEGGFIFFCEGGFHGCGLCGVRVCMCRYGCSMRAVSCASRLLVKMCGVECFLVQYVDAIR